MSSNKFYRILVWPLMTIIVYGTFRSVIYDRLSPWLWGYLNLQEGTWLDITSVTAALCLIVVGWKHKRAKYSAFHIGAFCSIIILLLFFWLDNSSTPFLKAFGKYPVWLLLFCSYTLGLFSHFIYGIISRKPRVSEFEHSSILLFQDLPVENLDDDKLRFEELAKRIVSSILEYRGDRSLSIGITGAWGAGKTTLLNFVKNYLLTCKDVIIIDFSPRQSAAVQDIQRDFLFELGKSLAIYHSGAQKVTERYMHAIGTLPDSLWAARVIGAIGSRDVSEKRKEISDIISEIGKRVIVFVDDFDRLTGEEIQEVLKLIDKNAAFKGTFYLTAYDKTHTNSVIASYQGDATGTRDYTDKYFNLEVSVPIRYSGRYVGILREYLYSLSDTKIIGCSHEEIESALPRLYPFMTKYLSTVRDVKRFANLISVYLPQVEHDVSLEDFLLTTLIRYKFPDEYVRLARHEFVALRSGNGIEKKTFILNIPNGDKLNCKDILDALFSEKTAKKGYRRVTHQNSFDHYFYDYDARDLQFKDLSKILDASITPEDFRKIIMPWLSNDRMKSDLIEFVLSYEQSSKGVDDVKRYLRLFFLTRTYCESRDLYIASLSYLLEGNVEENIKTFKKSDAKEFKGFFKAALNDMFEWPLSVETLHDALHAVNTLDTGEVPKLIFSPEELMEFARKKLSVAISHIREGKVDNWEVYRVLRACVTEYIPNGPGESIDAKALETLKEAIRENPEFFLKDVLGHSKAPKQFSGIQLQFKEEFPFFGLFKSQEGFKDFITELSQRTNEQINLCLSQFADYCVAQQTWKPILHVNGDLGRIKQSDYHMYNKLFEGEPVDA